jgi:DNA-binding transcriptional MerR regulator
MRRPLAVYGAATLVTFTAEAGQAARYTPRKPDKRSKEKRKQMAVRSKSAKAQAPVVPEKLYFRIGEVADLCKLPTYVLRFWESEFPQLKPVKSATGQRMYRQRDVENVLRIKQLLYQDGFTIPGARERLKGEIKEKRSQNVLPFPAAIPPSELKRIQHGLQEILTLLSARP